MRELEFLPAWYPILRRKRRIIVIEAWLAVAIVAVLGLWLILSAHNVIARETLLHVPGKATHPVQLRTSEAGRIGIAQTPDVGSGQADGSSWTQRADGPIDGHDGTNAAAKEWRCWT